MTLDTVGWLLGGHFWICCERWGFWIFIIIMYFLDGLVWCHCGLIGLIIIGVFPSINYLSECKVVMRGMLVSWGVDYIHTKSINWLCDYRGLSPSPSLSLSSPSLSLFSRNYTYTLIIILLMYSRRTHTHTHTHTHTCTHAGQAGVY